MQTRRGPRRPGDSCVHGLPATWGTGCSVFRAPPTNPARPAARTSRSRDGVSYPARKHVSRAVPGPLQSPRRLRITHFFFPPAGHLWPRTNFHVPRSPRKPHRPQRRGTTLSPDAASTTRKSLCVNGAMSYYFWPQESLVKTCPNTVIQNNGPRKK